MDIKVSSLRPNQGLDSLVGRDAYFDLIEFSYQ
jgi:hypothetical protein